MTTAFKVNEHGKVDALYQAGKDLVKTELSVAAANDIMKRGKRLKSTKWDYNLGISVTTDDIRDIWYFKKNVEAKTKHE